MTTLPLSHPQAKTASLVFYFFISSLVIPRSMKIENQESKIHLFTFPRVNAYIFPSAPKCAKISAN